MKKNLFLAFAFAFAIVAVIACNNNDDIANMENDTHREIPATSCSWEQAYDLVKKELSNLSLDSVDIYAYTKLIPAHSEIKTPIESIPSPGKNSWLFFVDEMPKGNWGHPCQYIFVDESSQVSVIKNDIYITKPALNELNLVNTSIISKEYNANYVTPQAKSSTTRSTALSNFYAVIINGGGNSQSNHFRYWNDCSYIYQTLIDKYNYDPSKVFVLMADGVDPAVDTSSGTSSPIDLDGDGTTDIDYAATNANVKSVFSQLASILTANDYLFIYTIDHGAFDSSRDESLLLLWNNETLYASDFSQMIKKINSKVTHIVMGQCCSGGFIKHFSMEPNICISTACKENESSCAMSNMQYDEYVYYWTQSHYMNNAADIDKNGFISAYESHEYANRMDSKKAFETPQHDGKSLLSKRLTLNGIVPKTTYTNYVDGYCMINEIEHSFYLDKPNHEPEFGIAGRDKIDITLTEPNLESDGIFSWSVVEGNDLLTFFAGNDKYAHIEFRSDLLVGQKLKIKVEAHIPIDNYAITQNLNFYVTSPNRMTKIADKTSEEKNSFN